MIDKFRKNEFVYMFLKYTLCFGIIMGFICSIFLKYHLSFIWGAWDGLHQHYVTLTYFKEVLINFITTGDLNTFTWNIGFGTNMFGNLAYYSFGDLFSYSSILVPKHLLKYLYSILVPIRLYFVGISFLLFCSHRKKLGTSSIIGSLMYTFCAFSMFSSVRHPYFINAMIVFPISMIGIEKFINDDKSILYIVSVFLMFFVSFYFGYMNAIVIAIYGIVLFFDKYKGNYQKNIYKLFLAFIYAVVGLLMCSFILVPTIYAFLNSCRNTAVFDISYTINYYRSMINSINTYVSGSNWSILGISSLALFTIPIFIKKRKKDYPIFILMIILILPLISSNISYVISGFSFPSNRYVYMLMFLISYASISVLNDKIVVDVKLYLLLIISYFFVLVILETGISVSLLVSLIIFFIIILIYIYKEKFVIRGKNYVISSVNVVVIIGILFNAYYLYDVHYVSYVTEFVENYNLENIYDTLNYNNLNYKEAINYLKEYDKSFYMVSHNVERFWNVSLLEDYNSINYFYSINSSLYKELSDDLNNRENKVNAEIVTLDDRVKINSLLGTKYYVMNKKVNNLYGYELIKEFDNNTYIYENKNNISFAKYYNQCISSNAYEKLNALEKENALLKYYISDDCDNEIFELSNIEKINFNYEKEYQKKFISNVDNNKIDIKPSSSLTGEVYVKIDNIEFENYDLEEKLVSIQRDVDKERLLSLNKWNTDDRGFTVAAKMNDITKIEEIYDSKHTYYNGDNDILINLGYFENYNDIIEIIFSKEGKYKFDKIEIYLVSFDKYKENIEQLNKSRFILDSYSDKFLKGTVDLEDSGMISFSTLYSKGFKVKVDGKYVDTIKNKYFLAINLEKGKHEIELEMVIPYFKEGMLLSLLGIILFIIIVIKKK